MKVNKANQLVGMLRRTFVYLDKNTFKQLFVSIVRPHLEYGAPIWNPHSKKLITLVENVQRRATKLLPGMENLSYKERLKSLDLPTLQYRRYRGDMIEVYKLTHELYDERITQGLLSYRSADSYNLRGHNYVIRGEKCKKDLKKFSFKNRIINQWNNLPAKLVNASTLNMFKNGLDKIWKHEDVMYNIDIDLFDKTIKQTR